MPVRQIKVVPDPILRQKAKRVSEIDDSIQKLIDDMVDTMKAAPGVGLAANQVGKALRIIVIQLPEEDVIVLVNPEIIKKGGERACQEGCLSVPGYQGELTRSVWVKIKGLNRQGEQVRIKGDELLAQVLEHEIDHLNGVLYLDRLESEDKLVPLEVEEGAMQQRLESEEL
ncbi:peptide deformylase [Chloroflexota bacterium]